MRHQPFSSPEQGVSLIELMVALGFLGVLIAVSGTFFTNADKVASFDKALKASSTANEQLAALISRDITFRDRSSATSITVLNNGLGVRIRRQTVGEIQTNNFYEVIYRTECRPQPAGLVPLYGNDFKVHFESPELASLSLCLRKAACPPRNVPIVNVIPLASGANIPRYVNRQYPITMSDGRQVEAIGTAACFFVTSNQVRLHVQTFYPKNSKSIGIISADRSIGLMGENFQVLPQ
jgi:type II secretory pathway pseudopilin PulG